MDLGGNDKFAGDADALNDSGELTQQQLKTVSDGLALLKHEIEHVRALFVELEARTTAEEHRRQTLEENFEDRMRATDWNNYTEELAAATDEIKAWRSGIEDERANFVKVLKLELQDSLQDCVSLQINRKLELRGGSPNGAINFDRAAEVSLADAEVQNRAAIQRLEQHYNHRTHALHDEIEGLNAYWAQRFNSIVELCQSKSVELVNAQREEIAQEIQSIATKVGAWKSGPNSASNADGPVESSIELRQLNVRIAELVEDARRFQENWQAAHDSMTQEMSRLNEQVQEAPPLLFELGVQLREVEHGLAAERDSRTTAIDSLSRRLDLVCTVFNAGQKAEKHAVEASEDGELTNFERHEKHLRLILQQVDNMATNQLTAIRDQLDQEQAERKSEVELIWSSLQGLSTRVAPPQQTQSAVPAVPSSRGPVALPHKVVPDPRCSRSLSPPGDDGNIVRLSSDNLKLWESQASNLESLVPKSQSAGPSMRAKPTQESVVLSGQIQPNQETVMQSSQMQPVNQEGVIQQHQRGISPVRMHNLSSPFYPTGESANLPLGGGIGRGFALPTAIPVSSSLKAPVREGSGSASIRFPGSSYRQAAMTSPNLASVNLIAQ